MDSLTPHFSVADFAQPAGYDCPAEPYPERWLDRLTPLCQILECIARESSSTLRVISGYRSPAYNRALGASPYSQHVRGTAADIQSATLPPCDLYALILCLIHYDGLSVGGLGLHPACVHVDTRPGAFTTWRRRKIQP